MPKPNLGERIRILRESKSLSQEQLAAKTRILVKYIQAIEGGRWDLLPGQVYLKPFVKNIADALDIDYKELYEMVEPLQLEQSPVPVERPGRRFDYRWLAVVVMAVIVILLVMVLKPSSRSGRNEQTEVPKAVTIINDGNLQKERRFSTRLDLLGRFSDIEDYHILHMKGTDPVRVLLLAGEDTAFSGTLAAGTEILRGSAEPFELRVGRVNCLEITYDGVRVDTVQAVRNNKLIHFSDLEEIEREVTEDVQ